ncbi:UDP-3-O-(3-hydroxymyristoyl)glucosamine N-acyltransferase [Wenyingzhuangia sp. 2_MG-2023]|uniref:UDP-3-O-(3-hydroxymyristoyl)glucosamine N-acyltransferase n=1 Tax=Wenyingzhuangia sp. 2_MG-2023 TaxID=3062639 RepID=UPI0026E17CFE|nr:UDP-3-O-(3-hydroxymyristoyl)glucosamine N-acyltransferase [Wenyingzhuangia sp. 2_MG-2023]MDO6737534.1 UDP-3-O-(3-hydroxymyristoyl)glucosamine N-acyltransferase [Wenyingzhuangia sp. 2_MG-2023]MDO6802837.1 UDP-3-O-(3-hydroxymyristoyl)glucosamine N-acyltransferase [Wenyingzhuangia sp. 1_MG-2023]
MEFKATQIAEILGGEIVGDSSATVSTLSKIEEGEKGSMTFLSNPKYTNYIYSTNASIVIVNSDFVPAKEISATLIKVQDAYQAFTQILEFYNEYKNQKSGIESPVSISETAKIGSDAYIGAFVYIGANAVLGNNVKIYPGCYIGDNVIVKDNTTLYAGVKVYSDCEIGNNCKIHAGVVVGSDGFGFAPTETGEYKTIPQIGNVIIHDNVDIGANSTIDRATMGSTVIGKGVKLDNLTQVAHNATIGKNTVMASQSGIAGSSSVGDNCMIGGQVGISGHISVGNNVKISAKTGVAKNIKDGAIIRGIPSMNYNDYNKSYVYFKKLPSIIEELKNK